MIPYNNSIIVPVDTGYGNIKNSLHSFPTGISAYKTNPAFEGRILHIGEMYYRIGEGHKEYIPDKTVDEEFRLLTIAAICDECRSCGYYVGNIFLEEAEKYCRKIFDALYRCEYDPDFMKLYVCGGGVRLIRRFGNYPSGRVIFIDDICATAKGYQQFALKTLKSLEKRVCLEHSLKIIKNPKKHSSVKYKEWDSRKKGCSWKVKMADVINRLIVHDDVTDITSLIEKMCEYGYVFTNEKRMIAKPANVKYGCSVAKLGYGYSLEMLQIRIANKQNEFAGLKISAYLGVQVDYAVTILEKQIELYRSRPNTSNVTYAEVRRTAELLCYIHNNHIHSVDELKIVVSNAKAKVDMLSRKFSYLERQEKLLELLNEYGEEYDRLLNHTDRNEFQQKRLEELYREFVHGGLCGYDTHSPGWLPKLKYYLKQQVMPFIQRDIEELSKILSSQLS